MIPRQSTCLAANETKRIEEQRFVEELQLTLREKSHKPHPGKSARQNDCGILPSE